MYTLFNRIVSVLIISALVSSPVKVYAAVEMPTGGNITVGTGTIGDVQNPDSATPTQTITQTSDRMIADWNSFSIGSGGTVTFTQPTQTSIALNRVNGGSISDIQGTLTANGRIFLVNPNGIVFGSNSQVNTAGLLASTLIYTGSDDDFMSGTNTFSFAKHAEANAGAIINQGKLGFVPNSPGSFVALLAPSVQNSGEIIVASSFNTIALASGNAMTLDLDALGQISVVISQAGDPGSAAAGVINSGKLRSPNGMVLINGQVVDTVLKNAVNNTGIIEANDIVITGNGDIELLESTSAEPSRVTARESNGGEATVLIESTKGDIDIINTEVTASIEVEGPADGDASIDILAGSDDSDIYIEGSEINAQVAAGHTEVNIVAGYYEEEKADSTATGDGEIDHVESLSGYGTINILYSGITASSTPYNDGISTDEIGIKAHNVYMDTNDIVASNEGKGWALVDVVAGDYEFEEAWMDYENEIFNGGELTIYDSLVLASNADGVGDNFRDAHVKAQGYWVVLGGSALVAQQKASGDAYVDVIAGSFEDIGKSAPDAPREAPYFDFRAGELSILDTLSMDDEVTPLIVGDDLAVAALVGGDAEDPVEVYIQGGNMFIENAAIRADVAGNGSAEIDITSGDISEQGEDLDNLYDYAEGQSYELTFGGGESTGTLDVLDSSLLARVSGNGESLVQLYASGDFNEEVAEFTALKSFSYPNGGINIERSSITAEAIGGGTEQATVTMQAGNYHKYEDMAQSNERQTGSFIDILDGSTVLAKSSSIFDVSGVELMANDIIIDNSAVSAEVDGNGSASAFLRAGEWIDDYYIYSDWEGGNSELTTGYVAVQNNGSVSAKVTGSGDTSVEMQAVDILLDKGTVKAEIGSSGVSGILMLGGIQNWTTGTDYSWTNREGSIGILNNSSVLASAAQGNSWEEFYVNRMDVKDSSVKALVTAGTGYSTITFYPDSNVDSYMQSRLITIDNGLIIADVAGTGEGWSLSDIQFGYQPGILYFDDIGLDIKNDSTLTASVKNGEAWIESDTTNDLNIQGSTLTALVDGTGDAQLDFNLFGEGNNFNVTNSELTAKVTGEGHAEVYVYNSENGDYFPEMLGDILDYFTDSKDMNGPIWGHINIANSTILAEANSSSEFNWDELFNGEEDNTAVIGMMSSSGIQLANSTLTAKELNHPAVVGLLTDGFVYVDKTSKVNATAADSAAAVGIMAMGSDEGGVSIDAPGTIKAEAGDGIGVVGLLGENNVKATGTISASGKEDGVGLMVGLLSDYISPYITIGLPWNIGSAALLGSMYGDLTLGNISADLVGAGALFGNPDMYGTGGNIIGTSGLVKSKLLLMLALRNIGSPSQPINTDVDAVGAISTDEGDIFLKEANDIELGLFVPVSGGVNWSEARTLLASVEDSFYTGIGVSVAATDGIIHVESQGDMLVNSIISPYGGVYLKSFNGSIYAGQGWDPTVYCGDGCGELAYDMAMELYFTMGVELPEDFLGPIQSGLEMLVMPQPFVEDDGEGSGNYFLPFMLGEIYDGPNVIAGGHSYFSTPNGTIGVGYVRDGYKNPDISGQILGVVRPGATAVTGLNPSVDLDLTQGVPPGLVYYDDNSSYSGSPTDGSAVANSGPKQVWPKKPIASPIPDNINPLKVHIEVLPGSHSAVPSGFTPLVSGLTLQIGNLAPQPQPQPLNTGVSQLVNPLGKNFRAYYEILDAFRLVSFEPMTPTTFFAYHPLSEADGGAFDGMNLDEEAYEYIDGNINYTGEMNPYLEEGK